MCVAENYNTVYASNSNAGWRAGADYQQSTPGGGGQGSCGMYG